MEVKQEQYLGFQCLRLSNGRISAWLTEEVGLRLIGLALTDSSNLLAELPQAIIPVEGGPDYKLRGGHRLWYGPEDPALTYLPDDQPVETKVEAEYLEQRQPVDQSTGIQKSWRVALSPAAAKLTIEHEFTNTGQEPIRLAPWAITMLKPGGVAILPLPSEPSDSHGLQPNRQIVLWPYTPVGSEFIEWRDDAIFVRADMKSNALKIGAPNPAGWLAYLYKEFLFVKWADYDAGADYIDKGASSQLYCSPDVIELETLGPLLTLAPGQRVEHRETWSLRPQSQGPDQIMALYQKHFGS